MKIVKRIMCFMTVFVMCFSIVCMFPVNASASTGTGDDLLNYYLTGGTGDWEGVEYIPYSKEQSDKFFNNLSEYRRTAYPKIGGYADSSSEGWVFYDLTSPLSTFKYMFCLAKFARSSLGKNFYYSFFYGKDVDNPSYQVMLGFFSVSPLKFVLKNNRYYFSSDSKIFTYYLFFDVDEYQFYNYSHPCSEISCKISGEYSSNQSDSFSYPSDCSDIHKTLNYKPSGYSLILNINWEIYSNCDMEINGHNFRNEPFKSLKDQIEVKVTPEFGLDMDRVFDKNTGQNDYFKFEVTNNSDKNIQFCTSIVDEASDTSLEDLFAGTFIDGWFTEYFSEWDESYWNYVMDNQHYSDSYREDDKKFFGLMQGDVTRYAELRKGNFYWVLLKPDEHFEDYIYWENVKINPKKKYSFIVDCIPTELDYPTDIFYHMSLGTKIFPYSDKVKDDNYIKDSTIERYSISADDTVRVCNYVFSVMSMPEFTNKIRGGNAKISSGWSDTVAQASNPYFRKDLSNGGEIIPVENYTEFSGSLPDFNLNIDSISTDNVKDYISFPTQFFNLIKTFFVSFPSLWALVVFGLTATIVIAIVRYIKG